MGEYHVSVTSIRAFKECEKQYYYRITRPEASIPNKHMIFGAIAHKAIEIYEKKDREKRSLSSMVGWSLHEWERRTAAQASFLGDRPSPPKNFKKMYTNYIDKIRPDLPVGEKLIEHYFKLPLENNIRFVGKMDLVAGNGIYDWKTGDRPPDTYSIKDMQFSGYWWAYRKLFKADPERIVYGHLSSGNLYNIDMNRSLLEDFESTLDKTAKRVYNAWENDDFPREIGYQCSRCPFNNICFRELDDESNR